MPEELVAVFADPDAALRAVEALKSSGVERPQVASPAGFPLVHHADAAGDSKVQPWVAIAGGLCGLGTAIALQVITSRSLGLYVGGKPIVAWTAFGVIMFELTMLFAGGANFLALLVLAALARRKVSRAARDQLTAERIVVVVRLEGLNPAIAQAARGVLGPALVGGTP